MPRLIDADALNTEFLKYSYVLSRNNGFFAINLDAVLLEIRRAPTIDPENLRPHGRWEKSEDGYCGLALLECSLCRGECFDIDEDIELLNYRYCPNCGAKMDLEADHA